MKKLLICLTLFFLPCLVLSSCGSKSWNPERAQELCSKNFDELTSDDYDEMLDLLKSGWAYALSSDDNSTQEERLDFFHTFSNLDTRVKSMALPSNRRVISQSQADAYNAFAEKMINDIKERNQR